MDIDLPTGLLCGILVFLILCSAFFSASETALMAVNRYRLRHMAKKKHPGALIAESLLRHPDKLLSTILIGNNFANIFASSIMTLIALRYFGDLGLAVSTVVLTIIILIFGEVTPKTVAALNANRLSLLVGWPLRLLQTFFYPLVVVINGVSNGLLKLLGLQKSDIFNEHLSVEELRTVVDEAAGRIPSRHKRMLLRILDLKEMTVEDIMIPRHEIIGLDLTDDWSVIVERLRHAPYTRLPVHDGGIEHLLGMVHVRDVVNLLSQADEVDDETSKMRLKALLKDVHYLPEGTPLTTQLLNFQNRKERVGFVVDEYGDIMGLVTLEDILEEIVGEFTTDAAQVQSDIHPQADGSYWVDGSITVRELNRELQWDLPMSGPKTLNGLIMEHLEFVPAPGVCLKIKGHAMEILETQEQKIKTVKMMNLS